MLVNCGIESKTPNNLTNSRWLMQPSSRKVTTQAPNQADPLPVIEYDRFLEPVTEALTPYVAADIVNFRGDPVIY
jgi:hypothetical protein